MMHEQDPAKGGCEFRQFITVTPDVLLKQYRVFDTLAVPLYPSPEHRAISIRHGLRNLGAKEQKQSFFARLSGEARSRAASVSESSPGPASTDETELPALPPQESAQPTAARRASGIELAPQGVQLPEPSCSGEPSHRNGDAGQGAATAAEGAAPAASDSSGTRCEGAGAHAAAASQAAGSPLSRTAAPAAAHPERPQNTRRPASSGGMSSRASAGRDRRGSDLHGFNEGSAPTKDKPEPQFEREQSRAKHARLHQRERHEAEEPTTSSDVVQQSSSANPASLQC